MTFAKSKYVVFLIVLFTSTFSHAQSEVTIVGTVKDTAQNLIPYVDVLLKQNDSTQKLLVIVSTHYK